MHMIFTSLPDWCQEVDDLGYEEVISSLDISQDLFSVSEPRTPVIVYGLIY